MPESRYDEARRCPRCEVSGALDKKESQADRSVVYTFRCHNTRCEDYGFGWLMQVLNNNEIPLHTERKERWDKWSRKWRQPLRGKLSAP